MRFHKEMLGKILLVTNAHACKSGLDRCTGGAASSVEVAWLDMVAKIFFPEKVFFPAIYRSTWFSSLATFGVAC